MLWAVTTSCCIASCFRTRAVGTTSILATVGSSGLPKGIPVPIQRAITQYSCDPGPSRLPPPWGNCAVAFWSKKASLWGGREDATPPGFIDQRIVINPGLEPEQADLESVLTIRLAVAAARIAAELGENRHDLIGEVHRRPVSKLPDRDFDPCFDAPLPHPDRRRAVASSRDQARRLDRRDLRTRTGIPNLGGQAAAGTITSLLAFTPSA